MTKQGFIRTPYYPQLSAIFINDQNNIAKALVLSLILYWTSRDLDSCFERKAHEKQIARHLQLNDSFVAQTIDELLERKILYRQQQRLCANKISFDVINFIKKLHVENVEFKELILVDYVKLSSALAQANIHINTKLLTYAGDDFFEIYDYISDNKVHFIQGIIGSLSADYFDKAAFICAKLLHHLVNHDEDFMFKALAPGWKMLINPPASINDIASRFLHKDERAIDLGFSDGNFFMPDGDLYGSRFHKVIQKGNNKEAKILVACILLAICSVSTNCSFVSDLSYEHLEYAIVLLHDSLHIKARLDNCYFDYLYVDEPTRYKFLAKYQTTLNKLK